MPDGALAGLKVLDFTTILPAPIAPNFWPISALTLSRSNRPAETARAGLARSPAMSAIRKRADCSCI